jgi:general secretion pathway protein A
MHDNGGQEFYATLTKLDERHATFVIGSESVTVALGALAEQWSGYYTLLWRAPSVTATKIRQGQRGADVEWLSTQLAQIDGTAAESGADLKFDEAMASRVRQFQFAQGLTPDGTVGYQTMVRLSAVTDRTAPRLFPEQGAK